MPETKTVQIALNSEGVMIVRIRRAARYLHGLRATARAQASTHEGGRRCDGDRQDRAAFAELIGVSTWRPGWASPVCRRTPCQKWCTGIDLRQRGSNDRF